MPTPDARRALRLLAAAAWIVLPSCAMSRVSFDEPPEGFWMTQGRIVSVEGLSTGEWETTPQGLRVEVTEPGCSIIVRYGENTQRFEPVPGSQLVFGEKADYVLRPYDAPPVEPEAPSSVARDVGAPPALIPAHNVGLSDAPEAHAAYYEADEAFRRGLRLESSGDSPRAIEWFEQALVLDPGRLEFAEQLVLVLKSHGLELYQRGETRLATQHWERALEVLPGDVETIQLLERAQGAIGPDGEESLDEKN